MLAHEDDIVEFTYPDQNLMKNLSSFSFIGGSGYALYSLAEGDGLKKAILGKDARFIVVLKDQLGEQRTVRTFNFSRNLYFAILAIFWHFLTYLTTFGHFGQGCLIYRGP